jgi:uncharacterized coiled-coil DUF342 family protein
MTNLTENLEENLEELKQKKRELDNHIHQVSTMTERQKLLDLQNEVKEDRQRVKELEETAYQVAIENKSKIKTLLDEAERLRLESFDISADAWELQNRLHGKQVEMIKLRETIEKAKSL